MKYKYVILVLCLYIICFLAVEFVNAQSDDWKLLYKNSTSFEYVSDIKVNHSGKGGTANVSYKKLTKYTKPRNLFKSEKPYYIKNAKGLLSCFEKDYYIEILDVRDSNGKKINAKSLPFKKKYKTITQNSFEEKLFNRYCDPDKIAAAKEKLKAEIRYKNRDLIAQDNERKAKQAKLKKLYQPLVNEYGDITSVDKCSPTAMDYSDCDYKIHTSFKVVGSPSKGSIVGYAPVFFKGNDVFIKNGAIVKVFGAGKKKDYFENNYKKKNK